MVTNFMVKMGEIGSTHLHSCYLHTSSGMLWRLFLYLCNAVIANWHS